MYISVSFGFSLMVNVWVSSPPPFSHALLFQQCSQANNNHQVFFRISGGLFNPAVTLAMLLIRAISIGRAVCLFISQMLGGMLASVLVRFIFPENFNVRTTLGGGATIAQGIFIEAILTAELVFTIYMLAAEKHRATFIAPVGIGLALFIAELVGVQFTGGSLNPARSFGPCVITATFDSEHWIYWLGPFMGAVIAWAFYRFIKMLEYEVCFVIDLVFYLPIFPPPGVMIVLFADTARLYYRWPTLALMVIPSMIPPRTPSRQQKSKSLGTSRAWRASRPSPSPFELVARAGFRVGRNKTTKTKYRLDKRTEKQHFPPLYFYFPVTIMGHP